MQLTHLKTRASNMPTLIDLMIVVAVVGIIGIEAVFILIGLALLTTAAYLLLKFLLWSIRLLSHLLARHASDNSPNS
ncbi:MAG: hypothetical protein IPP57_09465 [Candidatus Obscuribacter sp.]|jgi:hypothetical protein|nr:hypothetical protein [Candidatus Obscuribacter sp.]MBK9771037.1 hypothetical protein [Candidatus Obscuribacter sp.]MDQ5966148.1 hypothetical protein [Cyanobacteriota bacterium erpe_2018_sw_39hr_WHONDRS-SW48-000098_B_bin.30]